MYIITMHFIVLRDQSLSGLLKIAEYLLKIPNLKLKESLRSLVEQALEIVCQNLAPESIFVSFER